MKTSAAVAMLTCIIVLPLLAQAPVPADLQKAMQERAASLPRGDAATWDRLTAPNFNVVGFDGVLLTKAQRLAQIKKIPSNPSAPAPKVEHEVVEVHGNTAVQRSQAGRAWVVLLWAKDKSGWRVNFAQVTPESTDSASVREAIDAGNARFVAGLKQGDGAALAAGYTRDAVLMAPNMPAWQGADAIRQGFTGFLAQFAVPDAKVSTQDVIITPYYVIERGTYQWTLHPKNGTGADVRDSGKYLTVWERQDDGSWKISRDINNSDLAAVR